MAKQVIQIKCRGSRVAPLAELTSIQGPLKELTEENYWKLRRRIETRGFDAPMFVWGKYILDGTQRDRVLAKMIEDGWELPGGLVPVCDIEADSLEDAKERVLGYVSQYGRVTEEGLYEFLEGESDLDLETLDLPDFNMKAFEAGWLRDDAVEGLRPATAQPQIERHTVTPADITRASSELGQPPGSTRKKIAVICPQCGKEFQIDAV